MKTTMNLLLLTLTLFTLNSMARELPSASDYDKNPEEVFNPQLTMKVPLREPLQSVQTISEFSAVLRDYYYTFRVKEDKNTQFKFSQDQALDWTTLVNLNNQAKQAWDLSLEIYKGNEEQLKDDYIRGRLKGEAKKAIQMLHHSIGLFLSSTTVQEFSLVNNLICSQNNNQINCPQSISRDFERKSSIVIGYSEEEGKSRGYPEQSADYVYVLNHLAERHFHALFTQVLLEFIAVGYPINYGTYNCGGARCVLRLFNRSKIVLTSSDIEWSVRGYSTNAEGDQQRGRLMNYVNALLSSYHSSQALPVISEADSQDPKLILLRQGLTAARIINHLAASPLECADWGLWPLASLDLIGSLAQSTYDIGRTSFESVDLDIFAIRMSQTCHRPLKYSIIASGSMNPDEGEIPISRPPDRFGIEYVGGPEAVSRIGAWRKLLSRQIQ
jgi:hypothetical protein